MLMSDVINGCCLLSTVGGVPPGPPVQAIPPLSSQPSSLISTTFPAEDEQHSQPISTQGLHYLHSAYRVGVFTL